MQRAACRGHELVMGTARRSGEPRRLRQTGALLRQRLRRASRCNRTNGIRYGGLSDEPGGCNGGRLVSDRVVPQAQRVNPMPKEHPLAKMARGPRAHLVFVLNGLFSIIRDQV